MAKTPRASNTSMATTVRTTNRIATVAAAIEEDCHQSIESLAVVPGTSVSTIDAIAWKIVLLGGSTKLLRVQQKQQCDVVHSELSAAVHRCCLTILDCIVKMNGTMVSHHTA